MIMFPHVEILELVSGIYAPVSVYMFVYNTIPYMNLCECEAENLICVAEMAAESNVHNP